MLIKKELLIFIFSALSAGCISSSINVDSVPQGADVFTSQLGEVPTKVGQTPMVLDVTSFKMAREPVTILAVKHGYKKESVLMPASSLGQAAKVGFFLTEDITQRGTQDLDASLEEMARSVAKIQELIRNKEFEQALTNINGLLLKYPNISTLYGLQGNTYYLQRNIEKALQSYKKAEVIAPNMETQRMIHKLEGIRGGGQQ
jgi:tetratricopeptide (TPR) repeat protein